MTELVPGQSKNDIFVAVYDLNKDTIKKMQEKALVMVKLHSKMKMQFNGNELLTTALLMFVVSGKTCYKFHI